MTPFHATIHSLVSDTSVPDLSLRQLDVLLTAVSTPKLECTVKALASLLNVSKPAITRGADRLTELGYLRREYDPRDKRSVLLVATPRGRAFVARVEGGLVGRAAA